MVLSTFYSHLLLLKGLQNSPFGTLWKACRGQHFFWAVLGSDLGGVLAFTHPLPKSKIFCFSSGWFAFCNFRPNGPFTCLEKVSKVPFRQHVKSFFSSLGEIKFGSTNLDILAQIWEMLIQVHPRLGEKRLLAYCLDYTL